MSRVRAPTRALCAAVTTGLVAVLATTTQTPASDARPATADRPTASLASTSPNLLANPGADAGAASPDGYQTVPIPSWTVTSGAPVVVSYGTPDFPSATSGGSSNRGANFFAGGNNGDAGLTQTVSLSSYATDIDAGRATYSLAGWLGGYNAQNDRAAVTATFLSSSGATLGSGTIGPVTATDRGSVTKFLQRSSGGAVPTGTRSVKVAIAFTRSYGYDDGYADDLSLTVTTGATQATGNLVVDPGAESAAICSPTGLDGMTMPGWKVTSGEPNAVCYGASDFPTSGTPGSPTRGTAFFDGGATGNSSLTQTVDVSSGGTAIDAGGVTYNLSGWLGGYSSQTDRVGLTATFRSATGTSLGTATLGPVTNTDRSSTTQFLQRSATGGIPAGTRKIDLVLAFTYGAGSVTDGYADDLSLTLSTPVTAPTLTPPPSTVPGYDHVFFVMMENQDYEDIIGNTAQAPYINQLATANSNLTQAYGITHPSDPNYVAVAGGGLYGLTDNSILTTSIDATHLGNRVEAVGKTWKQYVENQNGDCDTSVHGSYYPDDVPFYYFKQMKTDNAYCKAHWQPLPKMVTDLQSTSTTPNFVWFAADGCDDMEGCGITAGDTWLKNTLPSIFNSPAWTQQRSLLVLTFDEGQTKAYGPNYPNHIPTVLIGSQGTTKVGYNSSGRVDLYGLLRVIDGALGLTPLTNNDKYAETVTDVWK